MASFNDYYDSMSGWNVPLFHKDQGTGMTGADATSITPFFASQPVASALAPATVRDITFPTVGTPDGGFLDSFKTWSKDWIGTKEAPGPLGFAMGAGQGIFNGWLGMQQYGLAKQKLEESKRQFDLNYGAQKQLTNSQLEDRQRARVASNSGAYQSVGDYMNQYGVK